MPIIKHKLLYFILYWISIYYFSISGSKRLQLQQKDISKYWPPFFIASLVQNCLLPWYVDYKGRKGIGLDWFKLWSVGALQTKMVVSQDPHRRERGKETATLRRPSVKSLRTLQVAESKFKIQIETVGFFLRWKPKSFALYSQACPLLLSCPFPSIKWEKSLIQAMGHQFDFW